MMNLKSRSINAKKNTIIGICCQMIILILSFASRTVFIKLLGVEYLGINGLYSNILSVLSLAELGIGHVMVYSLYKPIVEKDQAQISALLNYYKKIYRKIGIAILILGVSMVPFLDKIVVNSNLSYEELVLYYILFLLNSVVSYFFIYKTTLINADQKNYIVNVLNTAFIVIKYIVQIMVLMKTKNYILYLLVEITTTILNNAYISYKADKMYPFIKKQIGFTQIDTKAIKASIKSMFLYKIGVTIMNSTDNILISIIIGTTYVGYYSNYSLIVAIVSNFIAILVQAIFSGIGNLNASGDMLKSYKLFKSLLLFFHWITAVSSLCFLLVFNDFITIWIGQSYLLSADVIVVIVFNFYILNIINPVWMYRETMGMFNQIKYTIILAAIINLIFSVVLGIYWGLAGILFSTVLSRLLTTVWYEPRLIYNTKFKQPVRKYWGIQFKYFLATVLGIFVAMVLTYNMPSSLMFIFIKIFIGFLVMSLVFLATNFKSEEFLMLRGYALSFMKR